MASFDQATSFIALLDCTRPGQEGILDTFELSALHFTSGGQAVPNPNGIDRTKGWLTLSDRRMPANQRMHFWFGREASSGSYQIRTATERFPFYNRALGWSHNGYVGLYPHQDITPDWQLTDAQGRALTIVSAGHYRGMKLRHRPSGQYLRPYNRKVVDQSWFTYLNRAEGVELTFDLNVLSMNAPSA